MSVEAMSWALNLAPVPADRSGQPSSACKFVLVGLANHAGPDGTGAFPSVATLGPTLAGARTDGGGCVAEFFAALGDRWPLTDAQRSRLVPAILSALAVGWTPLTLAAWAAVNTTGVRNPYAVLAARLSPAELPEPKRKRPTRPPWCGHCDEVTRMLGFDGDAPRPCPRCKRTPRRTGANPSGAVAWGGVTCEAEAAN
jgi:hypothetical protein